LIADHTVSRGKGIMYSPENCMGGRWARGSAIAT